MYLFVFSGIIKTIQNNDTWLSQLFSLFGKRITKIIENGRQKLQVGARVSTCNFCSLFSIIINYSDYALRKNKKMKGISWCGLRRCLELLGWLINRLGDPHLSWAIFPKYSQLFLIIPGIIMRIIKHKENNDSNASPSVSSSAISFRL